MTINKIIILLFLVSISNLSFGQSKIDSVFLNDVKFKNSKFDNPHAGSSFLVRYKRKIYACTAKHVLLFAKTDSMKTVSFGDELTSWKLTSKVNSNTKIATGK